MAGLIRSLVSVLAVLGMVSVEKGGASVPVTRPPSSVNASLGPATTVVEPQGTALSQNDDSLLLDVAEVRDEVEQALNGLSQSLHKLELIEARLKDGPSCVGNPCRNGGTCSEETTGYTCLCPSGYSGSVCQTNTNECSSDPCQKNGTCFDGHDSFQCACAVGYAGFQCEIEPRDCSDLKRAAPGSVSGLYTIYPNDTLSARVYCDMDTDRGGWTVFQRRSNGRVNFYRNWEEYAAGFGELDGDFWLGNRLLHSLTSRRNCRLRVDLADFDSDSRVAKYIYFAVSSEQDEFRLTLRGYSGTVGDSLAVHNNANFSTKDVDNDGSSGNCAQMYKGGWWYASCHEANLNGLYLQGPHTSLADGMEWYAWRGYHYSLKATSMSIRRSTFNPGSAITHLIDTRTGVPCGVLVGQCTVCNSINPVIFTRE